MAKTIYFEFSFPMLNKMKYLCKRTYGNENIRCLKKLVLRENVEMHAR